MLDLQNDMRQCVTREIREVRTWESDEKRFVGVQTSAMEERTQITDTEMDQVKKW